MTGSVFQTACPRECPGCAHRNLDADQSAKQKAVWLKNRLTPWADKLEKIRTLPEEKRWGYRDKICLSAGYGPDGWRIGLRRDREVISIFDCPVHTPRIRTTLQIFKDILPASKSFPLAYYVQTGAQVTLVLKTTTLPDSEFIKAGEVMDRLKDCGVEGVWIHLHPSAGKRVFAKNGWHLVWGKPRSRGAGGATYGPTAFQQAIPALYEDALDTAETFLSPIPGDRIVDLYCGIGKTLTRWTKRGVSAIGVELAAEAIDCAKTNAPAAELLRGACAQRIPQLIDWLRHPGSGSGRRLVYANPPRTGLEPDVCRWIADTCRPEKMAYLSCSAGTLHRDLAFLSSAGFDVLRIIPYDFFPKTLHVETLVLIG